MADPGYIVFSGSSERDVMCGRLLWSSVTLHPPLESSLRDSQRDSLTKKNEKSSTFQQLLEALKTECLMMKAHSEDYLEQKAVYLQKAKRREEILSVLHRQRQERLKKEAISRPYKRSTAEVPGEVTSSQDIEAAIQEDIREVQQLE